MEKEGFVAGKSFYLPSVSPFSLGNEIAAEPTPAIPPTGKKRAATPAQPETPSQVKTDKLDMKGYSGAARVALSYQKNRKFLGEDVEIDPKLSWDALLDLVQTAAETKAQVNKEQTLKKFEEEALDNLRSKGATDQQLQYSEYLAKGGSPETVPLHAQMKAWAKAELKTEAEYEKVVRETLRLEGNRPELIDKFMEGLQDEDALKAEAKKAQERLDEMGDELWEEAKAEMATNEARQNAALEEEKKSIKAFVDNGFKGHKLQPTEAADFYKFLTDFSETIEIDANGEKYRRKVTPLQKKEHDIQNDKEAWLEKALYMFRGFNKMKEQAVESVMDSYLDGIEEDFEDEPTPTSPTPVKKAKTPFAMLQL